MSPWVSADPPAEHKAELITLALDWGGGDPRIRGSGKWLAVKDRAPGAFSVLMRWLTSASVMQFLDIVDASLDLPADRKMWSYRRAFWTSYLLGKDGLKIDEAWIAFGRDAAVQARRAAIRTGDKSFETHGIQTERSDQHSALIVKLGQKTIVDWSHSGKCQFWARDDPKAPKLYEPRYFGGLYSAPRQEIHSSPSTYSWQKKCAEIIEGHHFYSERPSWRPKRV
jgi:hypothetical protein